MLSLHGQFRNTESKCLSCKRSSRFTLRDKSTKYFWMVPAVGMRNNENMCASSLYLHISKCLLLELMHFGRHKIFSVPSDIVKWACHPNTSAPWFRRSVAGTSLQKTQVRFQANQRAICDVLSDTRTRFYPSTSVHPDSITAPVLHLSQTLNSAGGWLDKLWEAHF